MDWLRNRLKSDTTFLLGDLLVSMTYCLALALLKRQTSIECADDLLVLLAVPVYYAAFYFRRLTYLLAFSIGLFCVGVTWPIDWLVPVDLMTVAAAASVCAITGEVIHRASRKSRRLHRALLESEDLYRNVIGAAAAVPYFVDFRTHEYNMLGGEIEDLTGYSAEETTRSLMMGLTKEVQLLGALSGMSDDEAAQRIQTQPGLRWHAEYRIETRSGEERWLTDSAVQVKDTDGKAIIGMFGILQDITARKLAELDLHAREKKEREYRKELRLLHDAGNALSTELTLDGLCRKAVELGRETFEFDRLGLWILDPEDADTCLGTFGTDEFGETRDERGHRLRYSNTSLTAEFLREEARYALYRDTPLCNHQNEIVARGDLVYVGIWDANQVIGHISADNAVRKRPITRRQCELLALYAITVGHLHSLIEMRQEKEKSFLQEHPRLW